MKPFIKLLSVAVLLMVVSCVQKESPSSQLAEVIKTVQDHKGYDKKEYPLGLITKEYFISEADFASQQLERLTKIEANELTETEAISLELLKFKLQETIDYNTFERFNFSFKPTIYGSPYYQLQTSQRIFK